MFSGGRDLCRQESGPIEAAQICGESVHLWRSLTGVALTESRRLAAFPCIKQVCEGMFSRHGRQGRRQMAYRDINQMFLTTPGLSLHRNCVAIRRLHLKTTDYANMDRMSLIHQSIRPVSNSCPCKDGYNSSLPFWASISSGWADRIKTASCVSFDLNRFEWRRVHCCCRWLRSTKYVRSRGMVN